MSSWMLYVHTLSYVRHWGLRVCQRNELSLPVRGAGRLVGRLPRDETEYGDYEGPSFWLRLI